MLSRNVVSRGTRRITAVRAISNIGRRRDVYWRAYTRSRPPMPVRASLRILLLVFLLERAGEAWAAERVDRVDGACDRQMVGLAEDRDGNLWVGSHCGALRVGRAGFTGYGTGDGLAITFVNSIFESR